jgi:hypothetical protein
MHRVLAPAVRRSLVHFPDISDNLLKLVYVGDEVIAKTLLRPGLVNVYLQRMGRDLC